MEKEVKEQNVEKGL